ncbi:DUF5753 domain-containing protein [Streptosporangium roseum]|uniref:DUF5753 domain-containing protein n=1 Tax=Streptosporangium roseum TaxID=2001 RepID=UPI00332CC888
MQTSDYARAIITASRSGNTPDDVDRVVSVRMGRQKRLAGQDPLELSVILGEGVLHQRVGTAQISADQFDYLVEASQRPNIMIQILPYQVTGPPSSAG